MEKWHIALVAISIYLVLAFLIGIMAGKGKSFFSLSEYAVGDRSFNLFIMWFLMGGTIFSAFAFLGGPGWAFSKGAASFYILVYCTLGLMPWYVIGPKISKLGKKNNYITMGDFLGDRFQSKLLTIIVGIVAILAFIPYLTLQIKGMAYIFNVLTYDNIPYWFGAFISFGIVVIYVATSGVRGAAWSDVFQAILMLVIAWILGMYFVQKLHGGIGNMFETINVNAYGQAMKLRDLATVSIPEAKLVSIQVWDAGNISVIEKGIHESGLNLNPQTEGSIIRIVMPELNEERRQELAKTASKYAENSKISVRNVRQDAMNLLKRLHQANNYTDDEQREMADKIQNLTNEVIKSIETLSLSKEEEIKKV